MLSMTPSATACSAPKHFPLLGASASMLSIQADIDSAARTDAKVLLTGETGVGKEVVARTIHQRSARSGTAFITINCAGVPDSLLESEFFGHARGSFTGAFRDSPGLLRQAHGGTVFLDEIGEMSLRMQALLLRFLETGEIQTVGGSTQAHVDVRIITATNRNLLECAAAREFREDLYYRLNVFQIHIAPLRERASDVPMLVDHFVRGFAEQHKRAPLVMSGSTLDLLTAYPWPGNIRELRNVIERLVLRASTPTVEPSALPAEIASHVPAVQQDGAGDTTFLPHAARIGDILERLQVHKESFWTTAYSAFMSRDITRDDMRSIVRAGLEQTQGSYRLLLQLFNMTSDDYKRFLGFLKQHDCHLPFQRFRALKVPSRDDVQRLHPAAWTAPARMSDSASTPV
jgi:transcriptional regulator with PAS, ATPase and Fis domain